MRMRSKTVVCVVVWDSCQKIRGEQKEKKEEYKIKSSVRESNRLCSVIATVRYHDQRILDAARSRIAISNWRENRVKLMTPFPLTCLREIIWTSSRSQPKYDVRSLLFSHCPRTVRFLVIRESTIVASWRKCANVCRNFLRTHCVCYERRLCSLKPETSSKEWKLQDLVSLLCLWFSCFDRRCRINEED